MKPKAERSAIPATLPFEWLIFVVVLLVQQNAFVSLPILLQSVPLTEMREFDNPYNGAAVALSLLCIGGMCLFRLQAIAGIARTNVVALLFTGLVVLSISWSIHPDITIRRAVGYVLTMLVAALLPLRFGVGRFMKVLSLSFAVSAIGSIAFVFIAPQYGIMQEEGLAGCWQGVFCTKELFGSVMAVAVFVEAYIVVSCADRQRWRLCLLGLYCVLVILSRSKTALLTVVVYSVGVCVLLLWKRHRLLGLIGVMGIAFGLLTAFVVVELAPDLALSAIGKDSTLTGRTRLWPVVIELVKERPALGWGYRAMWQPNDPMTRRIDDIAGFAVPSSHNAFLEIALQLGLTGVALMIFFIFVALRQGARCFVKGRNSLGYFTIMFVISALMAGITTGTLGQNQVIEWLVFNALVFSCGICCPHGQVEMLTCGSAIDYQCAPARFREGGHAAQRGSFGVQVGTITGATSKSAFQASRGSATWRH